jgi:hypothetical protein
MPEATIQGTVLETFQRFWKYWTKRCPMEILSMRHRYSGFSETKRGTVRYGRVREPEGRRAGRSPG